VSRVAVAVDLDAPPEQVWRLIEPVEDHVRWMRDARAIRFTTPQRRGVGTRAVVATKIGPFRLDDAMTITEWREGQAMGVTHTGVVTGHGRFTLEPNAAGGTRFTWEERLAFPWWLGGPVGAAIARPVLAVTWRRNLRDLARIVAEERRRSAPPAP
jgi:hypothetical protein